MSEQIQDLERRVAALENSIQEISDRNTRVEADKAWETSYCRVLLLTAITYGVTAFVFYVISVPAPFLNALIPTVGYFLSTQTLPVIKQWWCKGKAHSE